MTTVLFVSNGHGEAAIAERIAAELRTMDPSGVRDHLPLVGESASEQMREVGPRRPMPSGGLIAMGNVRNMLRDLRAGLLSLLAAQRKFLRSVRGSYDAVVAVGDSYCLTMAQLARAKTIFVGTAKSVSVAPYGAFERRLLSRAQARFVRDDATARFLREAGLDVEPAANVIVDLFANATDPRACAATDGFDPALALFPGSRDSAYGDASFLLAVVADVAKKYPKLGAVLSIAPGLDPLRFADDARRAGWELHETGSERIPFVLSMQGRSVVRAWTGKLGAVLERVKLVLGQAGTANEGAAAAGVPVVAFARERDGGSQWYRRRQQGLLKGALAVLPGELSQAVAGVVELLNDPDRRREMSETGRARMGGPGGARRIAMRILSLASES
ncbi:MAG TPA: hypothetical protein VGI19_17660 [Candidatus Cybelea sp.]